MASDPATEAGAANRSFQRGLLVLLLLGASLRAPLLTRGIEIGSGPLQPREAEITTVARNFEREGMAIAYPRIDARGDGPGFVRMEFPVLSWLIAACRSSLGDDEGIGRLFSFLCSMLTILIFGVLARDLFSVPAALAAVAFLTFNPLYVRVSTAITPESLMLLGCVTFAYAAWRWLTSDAWSWYAVAAIAGATAVLAGAPAVHIVVLLLFLLIGLRRRSGLRDPRAWILAALVLAPGFLWHLHANRLWLDHGHSLGIHYGGRWMGSEALRQPGLLLDVLGAEVVHVWRGGALFVGLFGVVAARHLAGTRFGIAWLVAATSCLLVLARADGDPGAYIDHVVVIPAAALLVGSGMAAALELRPGPRTPAASALGLVAVAIVAMATGYAWSSRPATIVTTAVLIGAAVAAAWWRRERNVAAAASQPEEPRWRFIARRLDCAALICATAVACAWSMFVVVDTFADAQPNALYPCLRQFGPQVPASALLLTIGDGCVEREDRMLPDNASLLFYWMDRKGFAICRDAASIAVIEEYASRGAAFLVIERSPPGREPGSAEQLEQRFRVVDRCAAADLFDLRDPAPARHP